MEANKGSPIALLWAVALEPWFNLLKRRFRAARRGKNRL